MAKIEHMTPEQVQHGASYASGLLNKAVGEGKDLQTAHHETLSTMDESANTMFRGDKPKDVPATAVEAQRQASSDPMGDRLQRMSGSMRNTGEGQSWLGEMTRKYGHGGS